MAATRPATNYVEQTTTTTTSTPGSMRNYPQQQSSGAYNRDQDFGETRHHGRWTASGEATDLDSNRAGTRGPFNRSSSSSADYNRDRDFDRDFDRRDNRDYDRRDNRDYDRRDRDRDYNRDFSSSRGMNYGNQSTGYDFGALGHPGSSSFGSHPYGSSSFGPSSLGSHPYGASSMPYGSSSFGSHPYGASQSSFPFGSGSYGSHPYGTGLGAQHGMLSHPYDSSSSYGSSSFGSHPYSMGGYHSGYGSSYGSHPYSTSHYGSAMPIQHAMPLHYGSGMGMGMPQHYGSGMGMMGSGMGTRSLRSSNGMITPEVDIYELGNDYIIELDLPGHSKDHIETKREGNQLVILSKPPTRSHHNFHINERSLGQGHVHRKLYLPADADAEKINAHFLNGVLKLSIPRTTSTLGTSTLATPLVVAPTSTSTVLPATTVVRDTTTTTTETKRV